MRRGTFNYIKQVLLDYPNVDKYIEEREEELRFPHTPEDINGGIRGSSKGYDKNDRMMITIEKDRRLTNLEKNKLAVEETLDISCHDTKVIIEELYMKKRPNYTMEGLIESKKIFVGRSKASELRTEFFEELARNLDLTI